MRLRLTLVVLAVIVLVVGTPIAYVKVTGLKALATPAPLEASVARAVRSFAVPADLKRRVNPVGDSPEALKAGLEHFARYCAICHGNDGSGKDTPIGHGLFPKPPDMRERPTQDLTDGELFYIIENGVRFTGMPAFGSETPTDAGIRQTWELVRFVRRLPKLTRDDIAWMETLNPL